MSNKKYAYIDEFGSYGFEFSKDNVSTHFILTAIIVEDSKKDELEAKVEEIRKKYFQTGEIKSSHIGNNHQRRKIILNAIQALPFKIYAFVADKRKILENSGLRYKKSFYKFLNNFVYTELRINFRMLTVIADEVGGNEYIQSFSKYIKSKAQPLTFFDESEFNIVDSKKSVIVQLADFVSGCLAYSFDENKKLKAENNDYRKMLSSKLLKIKEFPETFDSYIVRKDSLDSKYNPQIAEICFRHAEAFLENHNSSEDIEIKQQVAVLNYLLFRFMNNSERKYIPTKELKNQLLYLGYDQISTQKFRTRIIAKLRDAGVIISSSPNGYKIPSTEEELCDFINHGQSIIVPMLSRLKKCRDAIKLGTNGDIDLFDKSEYNELKQFFD